MPIAIAGDCDFALRAQSQNRALSAEFRGEVRAQPPPRGLPPGNGLREVRLSLDSVLTYRLLWSERSVSISIFVVLWLA